jgi:hypothetical protein
MDHSKHSPGEIIVFREIWAGKIWTARPAIVVQDSAEILAFHVPLNTRWKRHRGTAGDHVTANELKNKTWALQDTIWEYFPDYIHLTIPGESYSVKIFQNDDDSLRCWYINLEDPEAPLHRTGIGFDSTDLLLDMIIEPNLKDWRWEDEDELQEVVEAGLISRAKAQALYAKGEEVRDLIVSGKSVFNRWEHWRPEPSWKVPALPPCWDIF